MRTMTRGRSGAGSQTNWNRTGTTSKRTTGAGTTGAGTTGAGTTTKRPATGYESFHCGFGNKIENFPWLVIRQ